MISLWGRIPHNNKLVNKQVAPAETAYIPGLYALEHVGEKEVQEVEKEVFGRIENNAAPVLEKLIGGGPGTLTVQERYWWTVYLNAAMFRVPHNVAKIREGTIEKIEKVLSQDIPEYTAQRGSAPENTLLQWAQANAPAHIANSWLRVLIDLLTREATIDRIINLNWFVKDVSNASNKLLLGDNPFHRVGGLYKTRTLISMPISPTHLFLASDAADIIRHFDETASRDIVTLRNQDTLTSAKKFVYGNAERSFLEKYLPMIDSGAAALVS